MLVTIIIWQLMITKNEDMARFIALIEKLHSIDSMFRTDSKKHCVVGKCGNITVRITDHKIYAEAVIYKKDISVHSEKAETLDDLNTNQINKVINNVR